VKCPLLLGCAEQAAVAHGGRLPRRGDDRAAGDIDGLLGTAQGDLAQHVHEQAAAAELRPGADLAAVEPVAGVELVADPEGLVRSV
jgi:hypothetical protein